MMAELWTELVTTLLAGGWLMVALALLAMLIYWLAFDTLLSLPRVGNKGDEVFQQLDSSAEVVLFDRGHLDFFRGRKILLKVLVSTAPLLGLLGTVSGMLATFQGLNQGNGNTADLVAAGISEAMITTEAGLLIAIPASVMIMMINSRIVAIESTLMGVVNKIRKHELSFPNDLATTKRVTPP